MALWPSCGGIAIIDGETRVGPGGVDGAGGAIAASGGHAPSSSATSTGGADATVSGGAGERPIYDCDNPPPYGVTDCCDGELCRGRCNDLRECECWLIEGGCFPGSACCPNAVGCAAEETCPK